MSNIFCMVWLNLSPIPVGRRGVISSFKWFLSVYATCRGGGGVGALWGEVWKMWWWEGPWIFLSVQFFLHCGGGGGHRQRGGKKRTQNEAKTKVFHHRGRREISCQDFPCIHTLHNPPLSLVICFQITWDTVHRIKRKFLFLINKKNLTQFCVVKVLKLKNHLYYTIMSSCLEIVSKIFQGCFHLPSSAVLELFHVSCWSDTGKKEERNTICFFLFLYIIQHSFICRPSDQLCRRMMGSNPGLLRLWQ